MEKRSTFSQLVFVKKHRKNSNGEVPIYLRITLNGNKLEMALHLSIDLKIWDVRSGNAIGSTKKAKNINNSIMSIKSSIYENYKYLRETKKEITPQLIKNAYLGIKNDNRKTILEIFKEHNEEIYTLLNIDYSLSTIKKYNTTYIHTERFIKNKYMKDDLFIEDINNKFVSNFEIYLKTEKNCSHNTTMKYLKHIKKIIRIAMANGWLHKDPFANYKMKFKTVDRPFLTEEELNTLINKKFSIQRLEFVKDSFLFSCFTGLAHSDLKKLTPKDIRTGSDGNKWVMINRTKTNMSSHIPVLPVTAMLIEKYKDNPYCLDKGVLLPVLSNQKMNAYLKEIADLCGIEKNLTSHIARHTFATTVTLNNDVPIETVSKMLGHSSIKMTKIYAKLLDKKVGRDMAHLQDKFNMIV